MQPLVSVVLPCFNGVSAGSGYLIRAINSIAQQDYEGPIELVLVDDGSTDDSAGVCQETARAWNPNSRRLVVVRRGHSGVTKSLNAGIKQAKGEYLARQDADDYSAPHRIREQVAYLQSNPDVALVGSAVRVVHGDSERDEVWYRQRNVRLGKGAFKEQTPFCHGSVTLRRTRVVEIGGYDERFPHSQDYDLFFRMACRWPVASLSEVLYYYRVHPKRVTSDKRRFVIQRDCAQTIRRRIQRELAKP